MIVLFSVDQRASKNPCFNSKPKAKENDILIKIVKQTIFFYENREEDGVDKMFSYLDFQKFNEVHPM